MTVCNHEIPEKHRKKAARFANKFATRKPGIKF